MISSDLEGKGNTYYLKKERLEKDSGYHRKISRICIDKELKTTRINSDYKHSDLAVVELERSFPDMDNFHSPLWNQPNQIFYPQDGIKNGKKGKMLHIELTYLIVLFYSGSKKNNLCNCVLIYLKGQTYCYTHGKNLIPSKKQGDHNTI